MDQYEFIRTAHRVYGKNISELSRLTGHSRNTVKKAIRGEPWGYRERAKQPFPVLGRYLATIEGWLTDDKEQPKKQRHTARRIYNRLVTEHGYPGGESTVRRYVRIAKITLGLDSPGAFIPGDPEAGFEAEVDWGTATAIIAGKRTSLKFFCMRSKYSGKHFVRVYPCERQQAFFDAHLHAFQFFGGIFPVLIYDNLTPAVRKVLQGRNRIEQESFRKFRAYHSFEARFTNRNAGNEKGGVEGLVGFSRRNYMVPVPEAASLKELNARLLEQCRAYGNHTIEGREHSVEVLFEAEKEHLVTMPESVFSNQQSLTCKVDKFGTVIVDKNRYSVPTRYAGQTVSVLLGVDSVAIYLKSRKLAVHKRLYGNNKWQLDPDHYLDLLQERPMAFNSARPIRQWRKSWPESLEKFLDCLRQAQGETKGTKDFIAVLMLYRNYEAAEVEAAVDLALGNNISSSQGVRHLLIYANAAESTSSALDGWESLPPADIKQPTGRGTMKETTLFELKANLKDLKLSAMVREIDATLRQATDSGIGYDELLIDLTRLEIESRAANRLKRRIREARFPLFKPLETFDLQAVPELDIRVFRELITCEYIKEHRNVIFLGSSGTGKTHMATALGLEACKNNYRTRFVTCYGLVNELIEAREERDLQRLIKRYSRYDLLILDKC